MFGDSSQDVFRAVAFLRGNITVDVCTSTKLAFAIRKARVAPIEKLTIPQYLLQISLLTARLRRDLRNAVMIMIDKIVM